MLMPIPSSIDFPIHHNNSSVLKRLHACITIIIVLTCLIVMCTIDSCSSMIWKQKIQKVFTEPLKEILFFKLCRCIYFRSECHSMYSGTILEQGSRSIEKVDCSVATASSLGYQQHSGCVPQLTKCRSTVTDLLVFQYLYVVGRGSELQVRVVLVVLYFPYCSVKRKKTLTEENENLVDIGHTFFMRL